MPSFAKGIAGLVAGQSDMSLVARSLEWAGGDPPVPYAPSGHHPDGLADAGNEWVDAMIAIRGEFPEARIIVLTTYTGDVQVLRALKAGARAYLLKNLLHKELLETIRAVHAGKKALSAEASYPTCRACHR